MSVPLGKMPDLEMSLPTCVVADGLGMMIKKTPTIAKKIAIEEVDNNITIHEIDILPS